MKRKSDYDVVISGAGYIGLTLASLIATDDLKIAVIDKRSESSLQKAEANLPNRLFSIADASLEILGDAGVLQQLYKYAQPINKIIVEDYVNNDELIFSPSEIGKEYFGCMIDEVHILEELTSQAKKQKNIDIYYNTEVMGIMNTAYHTEIELSDQSVLRSKLLVSADGKDSKIRSKLGIDVKKIDYHQDAIVCDIKHEINHQGVAVERFLPAGPFAILPKISGHRSCVIWTEKNKTGKLVSKMSKKDIEYMLQVRLCGYFGKIELASEIIYFPLKLLYAKKYVSDRFALCGDALHSIHPIAGQGLNLGLRDVKLLAKLIKENVSLGLDIGSKTLLARYDSEREFDVNLMINSTHNINGIFSSDLMPLRLLRKIGIKIINNIPTLKNYIMNYASGGKY
jgi:2-octaprenyl-6-methoxyphenol hydroxylase